jgi:hypothetical protein
MRFRFAPDWILLPAVALATFAGCLVGLELAARVLWPQQIVEACLTPSGAARGGCSYRMKAAEGPWVTVSFNACGSRSAHACDALPAGQRVVVLGSSVTRGYGVSYQDMFAPRAEAILSRACSTPVEFQNLSLRWPTGPDDSAFADVRSAAGRAAALHPRIVILVVTQWDMYEYVEPAPAAQTSGPRAWPAIGALSWLRDHMQWRIDAPMKLVRDRSRIVLAMRGFLNRDDQEYVKLYHTAGDISGYLQPVLPPSWTARVEMVERFAEPIAAEAARSGATFAVAYVPPEPQVLLARGLAADPEFDAYALSRAFRKAFSERGWGFFDVLPAFDAPGAPKLQFYRINGHPNAAGHAAIALGMAEALANDRGVCRPSTAPASSVRTPSVLRLRIDTASPARNPR